MSKNKSNSNLNNLYQFFDRFLFSWSNKIRKSNIAVVKYFVYFFLAQLIIYAIFFGQSKLHPFSWGTPIWALEVAIPTILTITGVIFTIIVLFSINPRGTQFGNEFIIILIDEINSLKTGEEITIISPNINIGTTTYQSLLSSLTNAIVKAKARNVTVTFKTLELDEAYLNTFVSTDKSKIGDYTNFYAAGKVNKSEMLTFLYESYDKHEVAKEEYVKTIEDLKKLLKCITISKPTTDILTKQIVGFLSNNKFYLGKYYPDSSNDKQITVRGEIIDTSETVQMLKDHFIKDL